MSITAEAMKIELWDIARVTPFELNSKLHDEKQVAKIAKSIKSFGWDQPIVVDAAGVIIKGHGRRLAAISLGQKQVPVLVRSDLTPDEVRAARVADNRVALGGVDSELLKQELAGLEFDLVGIFDEKELAFLDADLGEINMDAFVSDMPEEISRQAVEANRKAVEADARPVKIEKVLGFKTVDGRDERALATFLALIEDQTGKTGAEAFVEHARNYAKTLTQD